MNPNGPPRNHGDEIANVVYLHRDRAINAQREWDDNIEPISGRVFWPVVAVLMVGFWGPWIVGIVRIFNMMVQP